VYTSYSPRSGREVLNRTEPHDRWQCSRRVPPLFRQKQFLPQAGLGSAEAFAIILSLMILTFGIGGIGVLAWLISGSQNPHTPISGRTLGLLASFMLIVVSAAVFLGWQAKREPTATSAPQPHTPIGGAVASTQPVSEFDLRLQQTDPDIIWSNEVRRGVEAIIPRHNARFYLGSLRKYSRI
jgi:hypothetical protein